MAHGNRTFARPPSCRVERAGFKTVVRAAGLNDEISPYSLRHTMAKELRKRGVPAWEVEGLLGHRRPGVTETYAVYAPDYLLQGREAIDAYFADLGVSLPVPKGLCVSVPKACRDLSDSLRTL